MSTDSIAKAVLRPKQPLSLWNKRIALICLKNTSQDALSIQDGKTIDDRHALVAPTIDARLPNGMRAYEFKDDDSGPSKQGENNYRSDNRKYQDATTRDAEQRSSLCADILETLSYDSRVLMDSIPAFASALGKRQALEMYIEITKAHQEHAGKSVIALVEQLMAVREDPREGQALAAFFNQLEDASHALRAALGADVITLEQLSSIIILTRTSDAYSPLLSDLRFRAGSDKALISQGYATIKGKYSDYQRDVIEKKSPMPPLNGSNTTQNADTRVSHDRDVDVSSRSVLQVANQETDGFCPVCALKGTRHRHSIGACRSLASITPALKKMFDGIKEKRAGHQNKEQRPTPTSSTSPTTREPAEASAQAKAAAAVMDELDWVSSMTYTPLENNRDDRSRPPNIFDDSCCSVTVVNDFSELDKISILPTPREVKTSQAGGIFKLTHMGRLKGVSQLADPAVAIAYYGEGASANLFSEGALVRSGGTTSTSNGTKRYVDKNGVEFGSALLQRNNTFLISWYTDESIRMRRLVPESDTATVAAAATANESATLSLRSPCYEFISKERRARAAMAERLHNQVGHPADRDLKELVSSGTTSTDVSPADVDTWREIMRREGRFCLGCKAKNATHRNGASSVSEPAIYVGQRIFYDLKLLPGPSLRGQTQGLVSTDEVSDYIQVKGAMDKNETKNESITNALKKTVATFAKYGHKNEELRSDSEPTLSVAAEKAAETGGTLPGLSPPLQHQGRVENAIRRLLNGVEAIQATLPYRVPTFLHLEAMRASAASLNLGPRSSESPGPGFVGTTPSFLVTKQRPRFKLEDLPPFGAAVDCEAPSGDSQRRLVGIYLGLGIEEHSPTSARVLVRDTRPKKDANATGFKVIHRDVDNINILPTSNLFGWETNNAFRWSPTRRVKGPDGHQAQQQTAEYVHGREEEAAVDTGHDATHGPVETVERAEPKLETSDDDASLQTKDTRNGSDRENSNKPDVQVQKQPTRYPQRIRKQTDPGVFIRDEVDARDVAKASIRKAATEPTAASAASEPARTLHNTSEQLSLRTALLLCPHEAKSAFDIEMNKMDAFGTFETLSDDRQRLIRRDAYHKQVTLLRSKVFVKVKRDAAGKFIKVSARLVAGGDQQPDSTIGATYAPSAHDSSRIGMAFALYADAASRGTTGDIQKMSLDITAAYLYVDCKVGADLYVQLPDNIPHPLAGQIVRLKKQLYGTREANRGFYFHLTAALDRAGFEPLTTEPCIYRLKNALPNQRAFVNTVVDDLYAMAESTERPAPALVRLHDELKRTYKHGVTVDPDAINHAGLTITTTDAALTIAQPGFIGKLLKKYEVPAHRYAPTPHTATLFEGAPTDSPLTAPAPYHTLIGELLYAMKTRPDIALAVPYLAKFTASPTEWHRLAARRVLSYLAGTQSLGLRLDFASAAKHGARAFGWADASLACHVNSRSHGAYAVTMGPSSAPLLVKSGVIADAVCQSAAEAEYIVLAKAVKSILYVRSLLSDMGYKQVGPTVIFEDNESVINMATNHLVTQRSRHIDMKYHLVKFHTQHGNILPTWVQSEDQHVDILSKATHTVAAWQRARDALLNAATPSADDSITTANNSHK